MKVHPATPMKTLATIFILSLAAVCNGLAQTNTTVPTAGSTPTSLAQRIATADNIIVTRIYLYTNQLHPGFSMSISGDRVRKIVAAVSNGRRNQWADISQLDYQMQFLRGTNSLAYIDFGGHMFLAERGEYADSSGELWKLTLEILYGPKPGDK
jgi:hypothetical protein